MAETTSKRRVTAQKPPKEAAEALREASREAKAEKPKPRKPTGELGKVRERLIETITGLGVAQTTLGFMTQDPRHSVGGKVTADFAEPLADAYIDLARHNDRVRTVLVKMTEGSAAGGALIVTAGLVYSQAQVYGALPINMPNPWVDWSEYVPPSAEGLSHEAQQAGFVAPQNGAAEVTHPTAERAARESVEQQNADEAAAAAAEAERRRIEERRKKRGS